MDAPTDDFEEEGSRSLRTKGGEEEDEVAASTTLHLDRFPSSDASLDSIERRIQKDLAELKRWQAHMTFNLSDASSIDPDSSSA